MTDPPVRRTRQRLAVEAVLVGVSRFRTAQEIHHELRGRGSAVGLATVYRTLQALADTGEVDVLRTPDGQSAYRACSKGHHHHLVCRECGRTVEIDAPQVEAWAAAIAAAHGFADIDHELELFGRCALCAADGSR